MICSKSELEYKKSRKFCTCLLVYLRLYPVYPTSAVLRQCTYISCLFLYRPCGVIQVFGSYLPSPKSSPSQPVHHHQLASTQHYLQDIRRKGGRRSCLLERLIPTIPFRHLRPSLSPSWQSYHGDGDHAMWIHVEETHPEEGSGATPWPYLFP
jgi:hypothetical protein